MSPGFDWIALAEFAAIGLLSGGLLALIALGFVLIYKGTGVINFAMGEFMLLGAHFFYTARVMWDLPTWLALACTLAAVAGCAAQQFECVEAGGADGLDETGAGARADDLDEAEAVDGGGFMRAGEMRLEGG